MCGQTDRQTHTHTHRQTKISSRMYRKQASRLNLKVAASRQLTPSNIFFFIRGPRKLSRANTFSRILFRKTNREYLKSDNFFRNKKAANTLYREYFYKKIVAPRILFLKKHCKYCGNVKSKRTKKCKTPLKTDWYAAEN